jgi:hypothetical protein
MELLEAEFYTNLIINATSTDRHLFVSFGKEWLSLRHFSRTLLILSTVCSEIFCVTCIYEGHLESKERFAIKKYLLIIGKKTDMQVLSHTFTYFST